MDGVYVIVGVLVGLGVRVEVAVAVAVAVKVGVFETEGLGVGVSDGVGVGVGVNVCVAVGVSVTTGGFALATKRKRHRQHKHNKTKTDTAAISVFRSGFLDKKALICSIIIRSPWNRFFYGAGVGGGLKRICRTAIILATATTIESEIDLNNNVSCRKSSSFTGISPVMTGPSWLSV